MNSFCGRLKVWRTKLERGEYDMFPQLSELAKCKLPLELSLIFIQRVDNLEIEINRRFDDIPNVTKLNFVANPFTATADDVAEIGNKAQEELIDIQVNMTAKTSSREIWICRFLD
ncbi:hypothetical protein LOD99_884 [Oopsacas minuta]|uniref:Uncharacterized protein n=1 Tax=Oopsacas minuta TaxID=111878 RepID=A0AAV7K0L8_9METZ|nr:hypothetical protein LOD99_884 [Oopsacas minuta]